MTFTLTKMAAAGIQTAFHAVTFIALAFSTYYDHSHVNTIRNLTFGKFMFLTFWNAILQTLYYGLCVVADLVTDRRLATRLQRWRDNMHSAVAFPVGMFVVVTFWTLYAIDRELVFPKSLDHLVPPWLNHMLHTAVLPFLLVDKIFVHHRYPRRHWGILGACGLAFLYILWILFIAYYENFWVYPILEVLKTHERAIFISMCCAFFASFYILGESITSFIWRKDGANKTNNSNGSPRKQSKPKRK